MIAVIRAADEESSAGPGSLGFWVVVALALALFVLYRSMRKQIRRVDFDAEGTTDEERMHGHADDAERPGPADHQPHNGQDGRA